MPKTPHASRVLSKRRTNARKSNFEREVMKHLATAGYRVTPHWKIGTFRIDLVVEGDGRRLAIECDGDRYQPLDKLPDDMERQSALERMSWIFTRIRSSEFLRNRARAMKAVFEKLRALEIPPSAGAKEIELAGPTSHEVIDRVRRAEELPRSWSKTSGVSARSSARPPAAAKV
jgi:very-short-patch-repair endonuclease